MIDYYDAIRRSDEEILYTIRCRNAIDTFKGYKSQSFSDIDFVLECKNRYPGLFWHLRVLDEREIYDEGVLDMNKYRAPELELPARDKPDRYQKEGKYSLFTDLAECDFSKANKVEKRLANIGEV